MELDEESGIEGAFGEDYILKETPSNESRYENSETKERKDEN